MKRASLLLALVIMLGASVVLAAGIYEIPGSTFTGGGGHVASGSYSLDGSLGQPIAGAYGIGSYVLCAGLPGCDQSGLAPERVFLPLVRRSVDP
jgi:hypothetical protein